MESIVIGFTDGDDSESVTSLEELISNALSINVPIYTVGLGAVDTSVLTTLSTQTGGRFCFAPTNAEIKILFDQIDY